MKKRKRIFSIVMILALFFGSIQIPMSAHAMVITPVDVKMYTTSGTQVFARPDLFSPIVCLLERFVNVTVTGITENGFYEVDLNGKYYIPGIFLVSTIVPVKTAKQLALEDLGNFAQAYRDQLEMMQDYSTSFGLYDITGDGVPELFDLAGKEIYSYYNERAVMIYYSEYGNTYYYSKSQNRVAGKYNWNSKEYWEAYYMDYSLLPWGQMRCYSTDISALKNDMVVIPKSYTNDDSTRNDLYNTLKTMLSL